MPLLAALLAGTSPLPFSAQTKSQLARSFAQKQFETAN
jgi:hypothetical protein